MNYQGKTVDTIIWLQTSFLGDIILNTGAFNLVKKLYPKVRQVLITTPVGQKALADHPAIDQFIVFHKKSMSLPKAISSIKAQLKNSELGHGVLLQAHKSYRSSLLAMSLGFPRITYEESSFAFGARLVPRVAILHESIRAALLLEPLGLSREELFQSKMSLAVKEGNEASDTCFQGASGSLIAMAPGSVWGTKRWPAEYYAELAQNIINDGHTLVLMGSAQEEEQAEVIRKVIGSHERVIDLVGRTSLDDLRAIYPKLDLIVCNDSSPIHYASAFDVPTLAIFGPTVPAMGFGPRSSKNKVLGIQSKDMPCRPCSDHGPQRCPLSHFGCMKQLTVETVYAHLKQLL